MKDAWRAAAIVVIVAALALPGCAKATKPPTSTPAAKPSVPLPDWAPKNPSPEFLRAAKVLKPMPAEMLTPEGGMSASVKSGMSAALGERLQRVLFPVSYEFFGTLSDAQIARLRSTKYVQFPISSLSPTQRKVFTKWLGALNAAVRSTSPEDADFEVTLYKLGAARDLSNVDTGFGMQGRIVGVYFWIRPPDGKVRKVANCDFATL